jgi:hypothetical protein
LHGHAENLSRQRVVSHRRILNSCHHFCLGPGRVRRVAPCASEVREDSGFSQNPEQNQGNPTGRRRQRHGY